MSRVDRTMARHLAKKKPSRTRLNLQLPPDLLSWAKEYAKRTGTSVTQIITTHLRDLRQNDVPQI